MVQSCGVKATHSIPQTKPKKEQMTIMELNNATTIATWTGILVLIIEVICKHFGIEIPHETVVMFVTGLLTFIIAIISSKNPNDLEFLGNGSNTIDNTEPVLNPEYECDNDDHC